MRTRYIVLIALLTVLLSITSGTVLASNHSQASQPTVTITPVLLAQIVAAILSLTFSYVPGASDWWATLNAKQKSGIMALLLIVESLAIFGLSCGNVISGISCDKPGLIELASILIAALIANQATFMISPKPKKEPRIIG